VTDRGFEPAETKVPKGRPVTLVVTRTTDQTCATEMVFAGLEKRHDLPLNQPVRITLPAGEGGTLNYACGMDMIKGSIVRQ
jgi:plastocyanin domain-containing protein